MNLLRRIEAGWFAPAPASRLGLLRIAVGLFWLYRLVSNRAGFVRVVSVEAKYFEPEGLARLLDGPFSPALYSVLQDTTIALCVLWILGVGWRITGPAFATAALFVTSYRLSWGMLHHDSHLVMLHALALALAPAAAGASIDARLRSRWPHVPLLRAVTWSPGVAGSSWHYGWPLRLVSTITTLTYVVAGLSKVTSDVGFAWASGANLLDQIGANALSKDLLHHGAPPAVYTLYQHPEFIVAAGTGTLLLELGAPVALLGRRLAIMWIIGTIGMHANIAILMDLRFLYPLSGVAFLSFLPIERLLPARWR